MNFFKLNNGHKMPAVGMGTFFPSGDNEKDISTYLQALNIGYRHFDTAYSYRNEALVGTAIGKWLLSGGKREELFITTKLPTNGMTPEKVGHFLKLSLDALKLDYVDMYLIHQPIGMKYLSDENSFPKGEDGKPLLDMETDHQAIWKAMEEQVDKGITRTIGICNFNVAQIQKILKVARIPPANLQVELNAYFQQKNLQEEMNKNGILITAYSALGTPGIKQLFKRMAGIDTEERGLLDDPIVKEIAERKNKLPGQVLLRFLYEKGINSIPRSGNAERLQKNFDIFGFSLDEKELRALEDLDGKGVGGTGYGDLYDEVYKGHPEYQRNY